MAYIELDRLKLPMDIQQQYEKTRKNWICKLLYYIKYCLLYRTREYLNHNLFCIGIYGNPTCTLGYYVDLFTGVVDIEEFKQSYAFFISGIDPNDINCTSNEQRFKNLARISEQLDNLTSNEIPRTIDSPYSYFSLRGNFINDIQVNIPFNVSYRSLNLARITLICGTEGSGKSTLLKALAKAWQHQKLQYMQVPNDASRRIKPPTVFKLDSFNVTSQYVGCGEAYIRNVFNNAKNTRPSLVYMDGIELLLSNTAYDEDDDHFITSTLSSTLLTELFNMQQDTTFIASTSGSTQACELSPSFMNLVNMLLITK